MIPSFYRSRCLLPFTMLNYGYREKQEPVSRPKGLSQCTQCTQFTLCVDGKGEFIDDTGKKHEICAGDIFYFMPDTPHSYRNITDSWAVRFILIGGDAMIELMQKLGYSRSGAIHADKTTFNKVMTMWESANSHSSDTSNAISIAQLSVICYKTIVEISPFINNESAEARIKAQARLEPVISAINLRFGEDITLDLLSDILNVTPTYLCSLFKAAYNCSPVTYIKNTRMEKAKHILQSQKYLPIKEIATICGYADPSYFGKIFHKSFGMTPEQFRQSTTYKRNL